ncbi:hypothetical protein BJX63DRAFT_257458 [Aspergillus granulosus]|uniref:Uncharacterized protein n=1 Tax=Aspergillus granulosus TaxID=176169 RepID=A0ABR4I041_9EURO
MAAREEPGVRWAAAWLARAGEWQNQDWTGSGAWLMNGVRNGAASLRSDAAGWRREPDETSAKPLMHNVCFPLKATTMGIGGYQSKSPSVLASRPLLRGIACRPAQHRRGRSSPIRVEGLAPRSRGHHRANPRRHQPVRPQGQSIWPQINIQTLAPEAQENRSTIAGVAN